MESRGLRTILMWLSSSRHHKLMRSAKCSQRISSTSVAQLSPKLSRLISNSMCISPHGCGSFWVWLQVISSNLNCRRHWNHPTAQGGTSTAMDLRWRSGVAASVRSFVGSVPLGPDRLRGCGLPKGRFRGRRVLIGGDAGIGPWFVGRTWWLLFRRGLAKCGVPMCR